MVAGITADGWLAAITAMFGVLLTLAFALAVYVVRGLLNKIDKGDSETLTAVKENAKVTAETHNKVDAILVWAAYQQGKAGMPLDVIKSQPMEEIGVDVSR